MEETTVNTYNELIDEYLYKHDRKCLHDSVIEYILEQTSIEEVIRIAVHSKDKMGRVHPHQRHIRKIAYEKLLKALIPKKERINAIKDFDYLISLITTEGEKIFGVGEMLIYDTAFRIGKWKKIYPQKIYLHAGTRKGVERLMNKRKKDAYISKDSLPPPFNTCILACWQLENFFCIYKDSFSGNEKQSKKRQNTC